MHDVLTRVEGCAREKSLLRLILELYAHRAQPSMKASAEPSGAAGDPGAAADRTAGGAQAGAGAGAGGVSEGSGGGGGESAAARQADVRELQCSLADVEVLSQLWDQQPQQWREEVLEFALWTWGRRLTSCQLMTVSRGCLCKRLVALACPCHSDRRIT